MIRRSIITTATILACLDAALMVNFLTGATWPFEFTATGERQAAATWALVTFAVLAAIVTITWVGLPKGIQLGLKMHFKEIRVPVVVGGCKACGVSMPDPKKKAHQCESCGAKNSFKSTDGKYPSRLVSCGHCKTKFMKALPTAKCPHCKRAYQETMDQFLMPRADYGWNVVKGRM